MTKRHTMDFIKQQFGEEGFKVLSENYVNADTKIKYACPNEHEHAVSWGNWSQGCRCPHCSHIAKLTVEFVRSEFIKEGYKLITEVYKNSRQRLKYICPVGHEHTITWDDWKAGCRCLYCARVRIANNRRLNIDDIRASFEAENYTLLTDNYIRDNIKLKYRCPENHISSVTWNSWYHRHARCGVCWVINNTGPGNSSWKGGISCAPYCDAWADKEYKESIKERDGYVCINPDCWKTTNRLTIHHIDYNKKNCRPDNLITVCGSCNARANVHREWHEAWYQAVMYRRYSK